MLRYSLKPNRSRRRGAALLEFALVVPMLMLLLLGIMEFGWFAKNQLTVSNATREGARLASLGRPQAEIRTRVRNSLGTIKITEVILEYSQDSGATYLPFPADDTVHNQNNAPPGSLLRVTVRAVHNQLTSLSVFGREIRMSVTMVRERT